MMRESYHWRAGSGHASRALIQEYEGTVLENFLSSSTGKSKTILKEWNRAVYEHQKHYVSSADYESCEALTRKHLFCCGV